MAPVALRNFGGPCDEGGIGRREGVPVEPDIVLQPGAQMAPGLGGPVVQFTLMAASSGGAPLGLGAKERPEEAFLRWER